MPTNILRKRNAALSARNARARPARTSARILMIETGDVRLLATLLDTETAERLWMALPMFSSAETWGQAIRFEVSIESGLERGATASAQLGSLYFWPDEHRLILPFGQTPISQAGKIRLPVPCNPLATIETDLTPLQTVQPGQKIALRRASPTETVRPKT